VERKKDELQKKRQEEDKKKMEYVMDFVQYMNTAHGLQVTKSQHTSMVFREK